MIFVDEEGVVVVLIVGLYFILELLSVFDRCGIECYLVILYVGVGMFLFVKVDDMDDYKMYVEWGWIIVEMVVVLRVVKVCGNKVISVGIIFLWILESLMQYIGEILVFVDEIFIFIILGYCFWVIDVLMINFYLLCLILFMLVFVLFGFEIMQVVYYYVINEKYWFYSYGDVLLLFFVVVNVQERVMLEVFQKFGFKLIKMDGMVCCGEIVMLYGVVCMFVFMLVGM